MFYLLVYLELKKVASSNKQLNTDAFRVIIGIFMVEKANIFNAGKITHVVWEKTVGNQKDGSP